MIYFDNNATTRTFDCVAEAMRPFLTELYANPASAIAQFNGISRMIEREKSLLCAALGIESTERLIITSGATESNNLAICGAARANPRRRQIVISAIEHPSVLEVSEVLRKDGYRVFVLPAKADGTIELDALSQCLSPDTLLVSAMLVNNETGVFQPLNALAAIVKRYDEAILVHTDATQAVGKIPLDLTTELSAVDLMSFSAHKFHGPKGTGGLFVRDLDTILPILHGGAQQKGMRSGTENPAGLVGMSTALIKLLDIQKSSTPVSILRDQLEAGILTAHPGAFVLGASAQRLPTTLNICLPDLDAEELVDHLAAKGIAISAGSACSNGAQKPSHVASALGLSYEQAKSCIRLSLSVESTPAEVSSFLGIFPEVTSRLAQKPSIEREAHS
jgi:cysteine desulfurase